MTMPGEPPEAGRPRLSELLRSARPAILAEWEQAIRQLPVARDLPRLLLIDHVPELLERIGLMADAFAEGQHAPLAQDLAEVHAIERLQVGYDLAEVVAEYAVLRSTVSRHLWRHQILPSSTDALTVLNRAIDTAVASSVDRFTRARDRTLAALDRIATVSFESKNLEELLARLLGVFIDTTASVQTAAILLREGDVLVTRAAVGLEQEVAERFCLKIGEGFSGTIASERRPVFLRDAAADPLVKSSVLQAKGVRALYGVPLLEDGDVIGVMHMGSLAANEFSDQDKHLFAALASRTTAAISQHMLRDHLDAERTRFLDLVNNLDHAVVWEADGDTLEFSFVSEGAILVSGYTREEWTGGREFWRQHVPPEDRAKLFDILERCRSTGGDCHCEHQLLRGDGRIAWVRTGVHGTRARGKHLLQGVTLDITELRDALRAREQILGIVSHDLRNPLNSIVLAGQLLKSAAENDALAALRRPVDIILRSSDQMARMISDLLDLASLSAGRLSVKKAPEDPPEIVHDAVGAFEAAARAKNIHIQTELSEPLPRVDCDRGRVTQILSNLLSNAISATNRGGSIVVGAEAHHGEVLFSVADNGRGIPVSAIPRLFEPYWRGEAGAYQGSGLGLAITKGLIDAHGGRIWVESHVDQGTKFYFTLRTMDEMRDSAA
jgi:PAS domain S-box-containing protein